MTLHQKRFNGEFANWLRNYMETSGRWNIYQIMLKANEIWAESNGHYPEEDEVWIADLCYELLKVVEDIAWDNFDPENRESQDMLAYMCICELTAERIKEE